MNLGQAADLRYVNTSRPQLVHSSSKQSVTASDDYYSLTSDQSSNEGKPAPRYETPPLHSREPQQTDRPVTTIKTVEEERDNDPPAEKAIPREAQPIKRKPVSSVSSNGTMVQRPLSGSTPPTPGIDDTPYIHFAINQLTRDEEVNGSKAQRGVSELSYDEERDYPAKGQDHEIRMPPPPPIPPSDDPRLSPIDNVLVPTQPKEETFKYPRLSFVPRPLQPLSLGSLILCCIFMAVGLAFCGIYPHYHDGIYDYDGTGTRRYFVFEYLPQILASIIVLWLLTIQSALHRIYPFVALATGHGTVNSGVLYDAKLFSSNLLIPNLSYLTRGGPWLTLWSLTFWLAMFTVPLQSCLFQTRYFESQSIWRWTSSEPVAWLLFGLYILLILGLCALSLRFTLGETGLKWDPRSLADILSIFYRSNILNDFDHSEIETAVSRPPKDIKLGYWRHSRHGEETFYCIGDSNSPVRRYSLERGGKVRPVSDRPQLDLEAQKPESYAHDNFRNDIRNPRLRYRWTPWFLRDTFVVAWIVIATVLLIAFLVVSYVNQAAESGFLPQLPSPTSNDGFSPADFLYSFVPSFLGMILFLIWQPIDTYYRALQPFASLSDPRGSSAEKSLLLDYTACMPLQVTFRALLAGHLKVAWISFAGLMSITLPILAGGVFTAQWNAGAQQVRTAASMPGFTALTMFLIIYALSTLSLFPTKKRYLPHDISTLGELVSFFYQSHLLAEDAFKEPRSKIDLVTKLLANPLDEKMSTRFCFGIYYGADGKEHLGIDRKERPGYGEMLVDFS